MKKSKNALVQETRMLIQFAITVAIFFSSVLIAVTPNKFTAVLWGVTVAIHVVNYLMIEWVGSHIQMGWFKWLKRSLYVGILCFVPLIILLSVFGDKTFPMQYYPWLVSLLIASLAMPVVTWFMIVAHLDWLAVRDMYRLFRNRGYKAKRRAQHAQTRETA